jgi:hypothetical protein
MAVAAGIGSRSDGSKKDVRELQNEPNESILKSPPSKYFVSARWAQAYIASQSQADLNMISCDTGCTALKSFTWTEMLRCCVACL